MKKVHHSPAPHCRQRAYRRQLPGYAGILFCLALMSTQAGSAEPISVTPNASPEVKAVLQYLYAIRGKNILSGQQENNNQPKMDLDKLEEITGKAPAILGQDMGWGTSSDKWRGILVRKAKEHWQTYNGINTISWHTCPPTSGWSTDNCGWNDLNKGQPESLIDAVLRTGSTENKLWIKKIDTMAVYLKQLRDAGVPVLWRPFHELNGGWFWWGKQPRLKDLWIHQFERLTNYHKLNNLIWVYSPNCEMSYTDPMAEHYPGHRYVDMLGMDIYENYGHSYSQSHYDKLKQLGEGRPIAICENGKTPDVAKLASTQPDWVYFLTWSGFLGDQESWVRTVYSNSRVITADEIKITVPGTNTMVQARSVVNAQQFRQLSFRSRSGITVSTRENGRIIRIMDLRGRRAQAQD